MILAITLSIANVFAILGIGLFVLFLLKLFPKLSTWELAALAIPVGFGLNGWLLFMLGLYGYLNRETSILIILVGIIIFLFLCRHIKLQIAGRPNTLGFFLLTIIIYVFSLDLLEGLLPPGDADTLAYHFAMPKLMSETGGIVFTPRAVDGAVPLLIQMTYVPMLLIGGEVALTMWVFLTGWCLAFMLFVFARRYLSLNWCLSLVIILTTTPIIVGTSGTGQVETRLALFAIGSSFAIMLAIKKDAAAFFILAGLVAGFYAASKYYGLFFVLACGLVVFGNKNWFRNGILYSISAIIAGFQWYYWNWLNTGDPFFPILYDLINHSETPYWTEEHNLEKFNITQRELGVATNIFWYIFYPIKATIQGLPQFDSLRLGLGLYPLILLPFALVAIFRFRTHVLRHELLVFVIISIIFYSLWFFSETSQRIRHLLPILPLVLICFTVASNKIFSSINYFRPLGAGVALIIFVQVGIQSVFSIKTVTHLFSGESRERFLERTVNWYEPVGWANKNLSSSSKILSEMRWYSYLLKPSHHYGHPYYQALVNLLPQKTINTKTFVNEIKSLNITHIISWPKPDKERSDKPLDIYISKLSNMGCVEPLKAFQMRNYITSRTFWRNNEKGTVNSVLYKVNLSDCIVN